jgi:hypothetical protein
MSWSDFELHPRAYTQHRGTENTEDTEKSKTELNQF